MKDLSKTDARAQIVGIYLLFDRYQLIDVFHSGIALNA